VFTQIKFKRQGEFHWNYVYAASTEWADYIEKSLRFSGYEITHVSKDENPWKCHELLDTLWVQRDADGEAVALMDTEETNDWVYFSVDSMTSSKFGTRGPVERPVATKHEEW
jgi:hypothetical protein